VSYLLGFKINKLLPPVSPNRFSVSPPLCFYNFVYCGIFWEPTQFLQQNNYTCIFKIFAPYPCKHLSKWHLNGSGVFEIWTGVGRVSTLEHTWWYWYWISPKNFMAAWMVLLVLDFLKKKLHTRLVLGIRAQLWTLVLGFKANVGLAFGRYRVHISGIETT